VLREPAARRADAAIWQIIEPLLNGERLDGTIHQTAVTAFPSAAAPLLALVFPARAGKTHAVFNRNAILPQFA
jgi:hypothetical protein